MSLDHEDLRFCLSLGLEGRMPIGLYRDPSYHQNVQSSVKVAL